MNQSSVSKAYTWASLAALVVGLAAYCVGLFNATMMLNEKGYYLIVLLYGLFSFVSLQKALRDSAEGQPVSRPYVVMCWLSSAIAVALLSIGLYNAELLLSEKGFYLMAFVLSGFSAITVQKNIRDREGANEMVNDAE